MNRKLNDKQLEQAIAENHRQLFILNAVACAGELVASEGIMYSFTPPNEANIAFPLIDDTTASNSLDAMLDFFRKHQATNIGYWSLDPANPPRLAAWLLARGFETGWKPCWMAIDTNQVSTVGGENALSGSTDPSVMVSTNEPPAMVISADNDSPIHLVPNLPYNAESGTLSQKLFQQYPQRVQRFLGRIDEKVVAQCCLFFSEGDLAIAGMYNVGVIPAMRKKGLGKMIVSAAVTFARERGYRYVMLNANEQGRPVYERVGFRFISYGLTWWLMGRKYIDQPDPRFNIELAQTVGIGDVYALNVLEVPAGTDLNKPLINGLTLVQIAIECKQPAAVEWLINKGADCTVLNYWDLGWLDRAEKLVVESQGEINCKYFTWGGNLLHVAARRGDVALARFALDHGVDINHKDNEYHATPLDWAQYFRQWEIGKLISMHIS